MVFLFLFNHMQEQQKMSLLWISADELTLYSRFETKKSETKTIYIALPAERLARAHVN